MTFRRPLPASARRRAFALRTATFALLTAALAPLAGAQGTWPSAKPIRFIVPFAAGAETDVVARLVATKLSARPGYTVIVENVPGAGGNLGAERVLREAADGYTLLVTSGSIVANAVVTKQAVDPLNAMQPVVQFTSQPSVILANPKFKSLRDLLDAARAAPGSITYGTAGVGGLGHLAGEYFASAAGVKLNHIPYKGNGAAVTDLIGGQIDMMLGGVGGARSLAKSGQVRIVGVIAEQRVPELPDTPTLAESGVKLPRIDLWHGMFAARGVPMPIVAKLGADINAALHEADVAARLTSEGVTPVGGTPEQFGRLVRFDHERWQQIIKQAGIKVQ